MPEKKNKFIVKMSILNDADILAVAVGVDLNDTTGILLSVETNME